ncbi:Rne/Rng family ribonuclease, partial [Brevibacterium rongguiense]|uniref:Rne/Rng family ribonuclease n=1 Tax=Brevibacterium rongguiense TaxID=2695267 RepID=UPI001F3B59DD
MNNDNSQDRTTDPTAGILADLESLRASHQDADAQPRGGADSESVLDSIADAAAHLRAEPADSGEAPAQKAAKGGQRSARSAHSNRGRAFEDAIFSDSADDAAEPADAGAPAQEPEAPAASAPFSSGRMFSAQDEPVPYAPVGAPAGGGLLFQAPQAELGQQVDPDWSDEDDEEGQDDAGRGAGDDDDDEPAGRRRRGRRGARREADARGADDDADDRGAAAERTAGDGERAVADDDDSDDEGEGEGRRRRRGGRGRRSKKDEPSERGSGDDEADFGDAAAADDSSGGRSKRGGKSKKDRAKDAGAGEAPKAEGEHASDDDGEDDSEGGSRRRRRRARSGRGSNGSNDSGGSNGSGSASSSTGEDAVQGIKGSTRMEAKRQRRREGREAGRRRPVISEAEFLARRESVERSMLVREQDGRTQLVVLEDGIAVEHYLSERRAQASLIGNVYLGKVQNVLPSMEAAFIDIGKGRNAVLYAGEVNWDALGMNGKPRRIEVALKSGDSVLVQVTKDPIGHKGARLTSQISLPGRFLVYVPGNTMTGISRKLPDVERQRLKKLLKEIVPASAGVIVRTAAEGASEEEIGRDVERLTKRWDTIEKKSTSTKVLAPQLLYSEPDMIVRIVRDVFNEDFGALVVDGAEVWETISEYVESVAPDLRERVSRYDGEDDIFDHYRVSEQIDKALTRKVNLPSGGSLVIDRTEAMTVIDVNTGKFTGSGGNLEETVTKNNLEAAEEVIRQLRLRDIGGIIVVDFIDMVLESNRDLVVRRLVECLGRDRTKHQVAEVTSLGLVQMTRKRIGTGLAESFAAAGEDMNGLGLMLPESEPEPQPKRGRGKRRGSDDAGRDSGRGERADKGREQPESAEDEEKQTATRSAMAAVAKATLSKDEAAEQARAEAGAEGAPASEAGQDAAGGGEADGGSGQKRSGRGRRSRGRRAEGQDQTASEAADQGAAAGEAQSEGFQSEDAESAQGQGDGARSDGAPAADEPTAGAEQADEGRGARRGRRTRKRDV